jgi:hypothetical protein
MTSLKLTIDQLCNLSINFKRETKKGLTKKDATIKCLPSFIPPPQQIKKQLSRQGLRCRIIWSVDEQRGLGLADVRCRKGPLNYTRFAI